MEEEFLHVWIRKVLSYFKRGVSKQCSQENMWTAMIKYANSLGPYMRYKPITGPSRHNVHNIKAGGGVFIASKPIFPLVQLSHQVSVVLLWSGFVQVTKHCYNNEF